MAKNSLGELENAPGAARRESASVKREFVKTLQPYLDEKVSLSDKFIHNARIYSRHAKDAHINKELKRTPSEYRDLARTSMDSFRQAFQEITVLEKEINKHKWGARKDSSIAFLQTMRAKVLN